MLAGRGNAVVQFASMGGEVLLDPAWAISNDNPGGLSLCTVTFGTDGSISVVQNGGIDVLPASDNWWTANPETSIGDDYEVAFTAISGGFDIGPAINVWTRMTSSVSYTCRVAGPASPATSTANNVTFEIRRFSDSVVQDTVTGCSVQATN